MHQVLGCDRPVVYDADALNLAAADTLTLGNAAVITPHPGEAARLLGQSTAAVQADRFDALVRLARRDQAIVVLKGSGTLVGDTDAVSVCPYGGAAMATPGMGDVLAGMIVALLAQGLAPRQAGATAVTWHALAAELAANGHSRGILASDVIAALPGALYEI